MDKYEYSWEPMEAGREYDTINAASIGKAAKLAALHMFEGGDGDLAYVHIRPCGSDSAGDLYEYVVSVEMTANFKRCVPAKKEACND